MRRIFAAVVLALSFAPAASAGADKAEALFVPAGSASRDGALSDDVWQIAPPMTRFVQREPHEGVDPTERTEFRVAYDSTTLFVKVHAFDREPEKIVSYLTRRDDDSPCDWIRIFIDSFHD